MFLDERHKQIIDLLERDGRVAVSELAPRFGVTEDCIRKDLKQLASQGKCRRVYGGATRVEVPVIREVRGRIGQLEPQKRAIAEKALALIEPGQTVFLDISTTTLELARLLAARGTACTVISPMVEILLVLGACPAITTICPGGTMDTTLDGFVGSLALESLGRFRFDAAFLGAYGIDAESGEVSTYDINDGSLKRCAIEHAAHAYLVSEARKVGTLGIYRFAHLGDFEAYICDEPDGEEAAAVRAAGLDVR